MIFKMVQAIKNGELLLKIKNKIIFRFIKNGTVINNILNYEYYEKLKKEFEDVINDFKTDNIRQNNPNVIWMCWLQGIENAPELIKACVNSVRKNQPDKELIIVDEKNISEYIQLPDYIIEKRRKGKIGDAHYSDLIRIELLCKWGGTWMDSTVLCTSNTNCEYIFDEPLFVYRQMDLDRTDKIPIVASNWFIHATSNNNILLLTRELLHRYWKTYDKAVHYFIFHLFFSIAAEYYGLDWDKVPMYNNNSPHTLQFELHNKFNQKRWEQITRMSDFHKLNHHNDYTKMEDSFFNYIIRYYND